MKAKCMEYEEGDSFPFYYFMDERIPPAHHPCTDDLYECWQPDAIENSEFNLVILLHNFPVRVRGCHFDFV